MGYWTHEARRRGGFTTEAVTTAAKWLLTEGGWHGWRRSLNLGTSGSIRVAERAGFEKEGLMRSFAPLNGERRDAYLFARIA